jgi:hypothetical protein
MGSIRKDLVAFGPGARQQARPTRRIEVLLLAACAGDTAAVGQLNLELGQIG